MARRTDIFAADFKPAPFWWEAAAPTDEGSAPLPAETEVAVIGSGYGGLSAALELARRGVDVTVLEAGLFGQGASTRNGGHVSGGVNLGKGAANAQGKVSGDDIFAESVDSLAHIAGIIEREGIECHWRETGRFVGAATRQHYETFRAKADMYNRHGLEAALIPRERQREVIGSDRFFGGLAVDRAAQLHPALYHRGLLDAARRNGARLCANNNVETIEREGDGFRLDTSAGSLRAQHVVATTNGYTGEATPWLQRRVVPINSYIIVTEELPEAEAQALSPQDRTLSDSKRLLNYFRLTPDRRRLLFGGRGSFSGAPAEEVAHMLYGMMLDVFPQLDGVRITHGWTGNIAFTFDGMPHFGTHEGVHYAMGCNGSGVATMTWLGHQAALKIVGGNRPSAFDGLPFPTRPLYSGRPWFLPWVGRWYQLMDRLDRMRT